MPTSERRDGPLRGAAGASISSADGTIVLMGVRGSKSREGWQTGGRIPALWCLMVAMQPRDATVEQTLARLARASHGVVARAELVRAGVTPEEIKQRVRRGALLREHRAGYRVGHRAPSVDARYMAAVRACGDCALLSGRSAAFLLGVLKGAAPPPEVTSRASNA